MAGEGGLTAAHSSGEFKHELNQVGGLNPNQPVGVQDVVSQAQVMVRDGGRRNESQIEPRWLRRSGHEGER